METVILEAPNLCSYIDDQRPNYVLFTGGIAGINDAQALELDPESLDGGPDQVKLER